MTNSTSITTKTTIIFVIFSLNLFVNIESLRLEIESGSTRCISEEIKRNAMTVGTYNVISPIEDQPLPPSHRIAARVTSPRGNDYHYKDGVESGNFSFTAGDTGNYMTCFWAPTHYPITKISIEFEWKTGINTRDWHNIAQKGQIDLLNGELKRLYETVKLIHDEMFYLREREEEMQELNKATKSKMAIFSFFSIILVMSVALLQLWHLKGYFERKKLL